MAEAETMPRRSRRPTKPPDRFQVQPGPSHHVNEDHQRDQSGPPPLAYYESDSDSEEEEDDGENEVDDMVGERQVIDEEVIVLEGRLHP